MTETSIMKITDDKVLYIISCIMSYYLRDTPKQKTKKKAPKKVLTTKYLMRQEWYRVPIYDVSN